MTWVTRPDAVAVIALCATRAEDRILFADAFRAAEAEAGVKALVLSNVATTPMSPGVERAANEDEQPKAMRFASDAADASREMANLFARVAASQKPVVACLQGRTLGTNFELALACRAIIATDEDATEVGLPAVTVGLLPAGNGLLRVAARAGLNVAIDLGVRGLRVSAHEAFNLGLLDEVVAPSVALEVACRRALWLNASPLPHARRPTRSPQAFGRGWVTERVHYAQRILFENTAPGRSLLFKRARVEAAEATHGHQPAALRILDVLERYSHKGFAPAAALEAQLFGELVVSETSHRLIELALAHDLCKRDPGVEATETQLARPYAVERLAVVGAGMMGAGIAYVSVDAGLPVRIKDATDVALGRGLKYVRERLDERVRHGALLARERDQRFALLSGTIDYAGVASADLVIEAVFEDLTLKQQVLRDIDNLAKDSCVIASNTSALPITKIAEASARPDRIVGMHYFSPVHRRQLLEVVRTPLSDPRAIATAVALGKRQGKTVLVVRDGTGFYTTRIFAPYLNEAAQLLTEGVSIGNVDQALADWGFPDGPLHVLDEMGIDIASHVAAEMQQAFGDRLRAPDALAALLADHRYGRKNGRGFYLYGRGHKAEKRVDDTVYQALRIRPYAKPMPEEITLRCSIALVNEALRCLDEGILRSPRDGDVGAVFGVGFPSFRGGPFRYVDILGAPEVLKRTRSLEQRFGARFEPAPLLVEMARKGKRFYN